jgi:uncharacterized protein
MTSVAQIWRYPVKSIGGEEVTATDIGALGVAGDRAWGLRDLDSGKILSAKTPSVGRLLLPMAAGYGAVPSPDPAIDAVTVTVGDMSLSSNHADQLSAVLSERLGRSVRFERATPADEMYESYWPELPDMALSDVTTDFPIAMFTGKGTFVDLAALHVVSTASLRKLRALAPESSVDVRRFRPNIVIDTDGTDFVDNSWAGRTATIGTATISFSLAAPRCIMTTLEQHDLPADRRILQTLAEHNKVAFDGFGNFACLGVYAEVLEPGHIRLGDQLTFT